MVDIGHYIVHIGDNLASILFEEISLMLWYRIVSALVEINNFPGVIV